jgi:hypothetical protein
VVPSEIELIEHLHSWQMRLANASNYQALFPFLEQNLDLQVHALRRGRCKEMWLPATSICGDCVHRQMSAVPGLLTEKRHIPPEIVVANRSEIHLHDRTHPRDGSSKRDWDSISALLL